MKKKICFTVSSIGTANAFLKDHIAALSEDYEVYLVANLTGNDLKMVNDFKISGYKSVQIERNINLLSDIKAVFTLQKYFNEMGFYVVHSVTPKAGLLSALAGAISNVPNRLHIYTGQVWATKQGLIRRILMFMDWLIARLNTKILVDGESQRQFLINHKIIKKNNSIVLGKGSISGVNIKRFTPSDEVRKNIRKELKLFDNQIVYVFLGRLTRDKGIYELLHAFNKLAQEDKNVFLLLVGVDEEDCLSLLSEFPLIKNEVNFHFYGLTPNPEILLQAGDVFCLPSHREGFGTSVLEASCLGVPVICSDTYGLMDAMVDGVTGLRHKVGQSESLFEKMKILAENKITRGTMGKNAIEFAKQNFSGEMITQEWINLYRQLPN